MVCFMSNNLLIWKGYGRGIPSSFLVQANKKNLEDTVICVRPLMGSAIGHVRYINIVAWLRDFKDKLLYLVYNFDPKALEPC